MSALEPPPGSPTFAIWPPHEAFYIDSMLSNSVQAMASLEYVAEALATASRSGSHAEELDEEALLSHLQNVVVQGAALSRYFWPVRAGHETRAQHLRAAFAISETSPLRSRHLRNALEHFDERLDAYLGREVVGHIVPRYVGRTPGPQSVPLHLFRGYFVDTGLFTLLGESYEMQLLADEIGRIHNLLVEFAENGGRLPHR